MAKQALTFAQLSEDDVAFREFLATTGEVWMRARGDTVREPEFPPLPMTDFLKRFEAKLTRNGSFGVYLGFERDIVCPPSCSIDYTEGSRRCTTTRVDDQQALLVMYIRGGIMDDGLLMLSSIGYRTHTERKPKEFLSWARRVLGWWDKRTAETVPLFNRTDLGRATPGAKAASLAGRKIA